jgi:anti-anti-sigma factor
VPFCEIRACNEGGAHVIRVRGELDRSHCSTLEGALADAESSQATLVLVDCNELQLIDAAGLHSLLAASRRSAGEGDRLRITRGDGSVAKTFRVSGLDAVLPLIGGPDGN